MCTQAVTHEGGVIAGYTAPFPTPPAPISLTCPLVCRAYILPNLTTPTPLLCWDGTDLLESVVRLACR